MTPRRFSPPPALGERPGEGADGRETARGSRATDGPASSDAPTATTDATGRPAVFLDRDGTLIHDRHYLADPAGVELLPGAGEAVARLNRAGLPVLLVTNQSGIGRGYFGEADFRAVQAAVEAALARHGARVDGVWHCPHAPDEGCDCRKPRAGLFLRAAAERGVDPAASWYVGDRVRDVEPGVRLGGRGLLVRAEGGAGEEAPPGVRTVASLAEAADTILVDRGRDD